MPPKLDDDLPDRARQILQVAERLFSKQGFFATSMDDIADAIGLTKPAIYHYFKAKDDILVQIRQRNIDEMLELARPVLDSDAAAVNKLRAILIAHTNRVITRRSVNKIYFEEASAVTGARARPIARAEEGYEEDLRKLYAQGIADGELRDVDPGIAVATILGSCNWSYRWFRPRGELSTMEMAELIVSLLLDGHRTR